MRNERFMWRVLKLAKRGEGKTSPNPMVGAILVKGDRIIGEGYHKGPGRPHAEIEAMSKTYLPTLRGSTLYVNLEPCNHYGRTPPCTLNIINAGIKEVVVAMRDPNPLVAGKGLAELKEAGIIIKEGVLSKEATILNEIYVKYITSKMPFGILKVAMSLDGKIAYTSNFLRQKDVKWITDESSRITARKLRAKVDAILVGKGTILSDNPMLTTRIPGQKDPIRIVVDSSGHTHLKSNVMKLPPPTIIAATKNISAKRKKLLESRGINVLIIPSHDDRVDLKVLFKELAKMEISTVLIEGGARINASVLADDLVDKVYLFVAPKLIGPQGLPMIIGEKSFEIPMNLKNVSCSRIKNEILITGYLKE